MADIIEKTALVVVSGLVGHYLAVWRFHATKDKRKLRCEGYYCEEDNTINFEVKHVGNKTADNIKMRFWCSPRDVIKRYQIYTQHFIICDRLDEKTGQCKLDTPQSFSCRWSYMNPQDHVLIQVRMSKCEHPFDARFEIDGKEICVAETRMKAVCKSDG